MTRVGHPHARPSPDAPRTAYNPQPSPLAYSPALILSPTLAPAPDRYILGNCDPVYILCPNLAGLSPNPESLIALRSMG